MTVKPGEWCAIGNSIIRQYLFPVDDDPFKMTLFEICCSHSNEAACKTKIELHLQPAIVRDDGWLIARLSEEEKILEADFFSVQVKLFTGPINLLTPCDDSAAEQWLGVLHSGNKMRFLLTNGIETLIDLPLRNDSNFSKLYEGVKSK